MFDLWKRSSSNSSENIKNDNIGPLKTEKTIEVYTSQNAVDSIFEETSRSEKEVSTKRNLKARHVQLIAISGSIGTALFVTIGSGLATAGPANFFIGMTFWSFVLWCINSCVAEMVCYLPVDSPFIQMAGRCVDEAFEVTVAFNFLIMMWMYVPFEITAVNSMIHYWRDDYSPAITFCVQIAIYCFINVFAVKVYGEAEFWLSIGKFVLAVGLLFFTLITMCGGNPKHDSFGFQYWNNPGAFAEYITTGALGRFEGFIAAIIKSCFIVVGPEYLSMVSGETENPRKVMAKCYKSIIYRLVVFYVFGSLSVGILVAYNDPKLLAGGSVASPYLIAMHNMGIKALPDIVNALILTSAFSAGNSYVYCGSRILFALSKRGFFFKQFSYTINGVPIFCIAVSIAFSFLSLLQLGSSSATVLDWMVNICTGAQVLNYTFMCISYVGFFRACKAQGIDRNTLPFRSWFQPYNAYFGIIITFVMVGMIGYDVFIPGHWSVDNFIIYYIMVFVDIAIFIFWKLFKRTSFRKPEEVDLVTGKAEIDQHELEYHEKVQRGEIAKGNLFERFLDIIL